MEKSGHLVKNVHFSTSDNKVWIFYDLQGEKKTTYQIQLLASTNGGKTYTISPTNVTGDIGRDVKAGKNKEIIWHIMEDYPDGLQGSDFQFLIKAHKEIPAINHQLLKYAAIGVAAIGVGVALILLLNGSNSSGGSGGFPLPPPRPAN
jgi:uncharacterized membrane-anchored protein YitT (DUF2179 family)